MKFSTNSTGNLDIMSPDEVFSSRLSWANDKIYPKSKRYSEPPLHISQAVSVLVARYGIQSYDYVLQAAWGLSSRAYMEYDFKHGSEIPFGGVIPDWMRTKNSEDRLELFMEFVIALLTVLGWVITWEDHDTYILNFHPLMSLSPDEVKLEETIKINVFATSVLEKINTLTTIRQFTFTSADIGMDKVPSGLRESVINRVRELLGKQWSFGETKSNHFYIAEV